MVKKKKRRKRRPGDLPQDLRIHIAELGLKSLAEYHAWCAARGFAQNPYKSWRQEREERLAAQEERQAAATAQHIGALGLGSEAEYQAWCRRQGFAIDLDKSVRQRQRELECARRLAVPAAESPPLPQVSTGHLEALGMAGVNEYQAWCRRQGFSDSLFKKPQQLQRELGKARLVAARRQTRHRPSRILQVLEDDFAAEKEQSEYLQRLEQTKRGLPDDQTRQALRHLVLATERCSGFFDLKPALSRFKDQPGNTFIEALGALARQRASWLRSPTDWRPQSRNPLRQFAALARHLFAQYPVPGFMDEAWFKGDEERALNQQQWFVHIGGGGNIRAVELPLVLSKMMAHHFLLAPAEFGIEAALRWGQIRGLGGDEDLVRAVVATRLGSSFANEPFWYSVLQFLVRTPMLDPDRVGPIVDYLYSRKYAPQQILQPDGGVGEGPPAEPNLSMKSRSAIKLLRCVEEWQGQQRKAAKRRKNTWAAVDTKGFDYREEDRQTGQVRQWTIRQLCSTAELGAEGHAMHNCVASYAPRCQRGRISIWSLQVSEGGRKPRHRMTISVDNRSKMITQTQTRGKKDIPDQILARWCKEELDPYGFMAQMAKK